MKRQVLTLLPFFMRWNVGATFTPRLCPSCLFFLLQSSLYSLMSGCSCRTAVVTEIDNAEHRSQSISLCSGAPNKQPDHTGHLSWYTQSAAEPEVQVKHNLLMLAAGTRAGVGSQAAPWLNG